MTTTVHTDTPDPTDPVNCVDCMDAPDPPEPIDLIDPTQLDPLGDFSLAEIDAGLELANAPLAHDLGLLSYSELRCIRAAAALEPAVDTLLRRARLVDVALAAGERGALEHENFGNDWLDAGHPLFGGERPIEACVHHDGWILAIIELRMMAGSVGVDVAAVHALAAAALARMQADDMSLDAAVQSLQFEGQLNAGPEQLWSATADRIRMASGSTSALLVAFAPSEQAMQLLARQRFGRCLADRMTIHQGPPSGIPVALRADAMIPALERLIALPPGEAQGYSIQLLLNEPITMYKRR